PGWTNQIHDTSSYSINNDATTAQDCCDSCVDDPGCLEWVFNAGYEGCYRVYDSTLTESICLNAMAFPATLQGPGSEGGIIRCGNSNACT
ncbi:4755_t:CDS:1, partial [Acaulospora morrowiae]